MYVCVYTSVWHVTTEVRRCHEIPWTWSCRWLCPAWHGFLELHWSPLTSALKCRVISPVPQLRLLSLTLQQLNTCCLLPKVFIFSQHKPNGCIGQVFEGSLYGALTRFNCQLVTTSSHPRRQSRLRECPGQINLWAVYGGWS